MLLSDVHRLYLSLALSVAAAAAADRHPSRWNHSVPLRPVADADGVGSVGRADAVDLVAAVAAAVAAQRTG